MQEKNERLRVLAEDARGKTAALAAGHDAMAVGSSRRTIRFRKAKARLRREAARAARAAPPMTEPLAHRFREADEAGTAKEPRVAMEGLDLAKFDLGRANAGPERRIPARTAKPATPNARPRDNEERPRLARRHADAGRPPLRKLFGPAEPVRPVSAARDAPRRRACRG